MGVSYTSGVNQASNKLNDVLKGVSRQKNYGAPAPTVSTNIFPDLEAKNIAYQNLVKDSSGDTSAVLGYDPQALITPTNLSKPMTDLSLGLSRLTMSGLSEQIDQRWNEQFQNALIDKAKLEGYNAGASEYMAGLGNVGNYNPGGPSKYGGNVAGYDTPYGLEPTFWSRLGAANAAMKAAGLGTFSVSSGYRTYAQQKNLRAEKPTLAAKPGTSRHEYGVAVDLNLSSRQRRWLQQNGKQFGLYQPMSYEPWHWQPL